MESMSRLDAGKEKNLPLYRRRLYIVQDIEAEALLMMETCTASVWIEI